MLNKIKTLNKLLLSSLNRNTFPKEIELDGNSLSLEKLSRLGSGEHKIKLTHDCISKINTSRKIVESIIQNHKPIYGFNTGFGQFSNICIENDNLEQLQFNLIRSHSTGVGDLLNLDQIRRISILRVNTLIRGHSGISLETLNTLIKLINSNIVAYCPSQGTVGASGDLVPLAHIALGLIGEGLLYNPSTQKYEEAIKVLKEFNIKPAVLKAKEGLSLINGTQFMTGIGSVALEKSINLIRAVNAISGLSFTALKGNPIYFDERIGEIRPHPGQIAISEIMRKIIPMGSILVNPKDVQSSYSLRCIPQVHGPVLEMISTVKEILETEMNSTTDNPLIFDYGDPNIFSNGNFHGEYVAKALDVLTIYVHELGNMSYPRIMRLLNKAKNDDLTTFLTYEGGLSSGMMTYENLAAALVSENKVHCTPASIDSLSTCADKEDHVSMGGYAARKAVTVSENVGKILTVELMAATKAIKMRLQMESDFKVPQSLKGIYEKVIEISPPFVKDRYSKLEYDKLYEYIMSGEIWEDVLTEIDKDYGKNYDPIIQNTYIQNEVIPSKTIKINEYKTTDLNIQIDDSNEVIKLTPIPTNDSGNILYTKERKNQTQIGELRNLFIKSEKPITTKIIGQAIKSKKLTTDNLFTLIDLSQDDIGSRANFGKGHLGNVYAFKSFLEKLSNHPYNKLNSIYINSLLLVGSLDLTDLISKCQNKNPYIPEQRKVLISSVNEIDERTQAVCKEIYESGSNLICLNGDNNITYSLIASLYKSFNKKVILIYLDIHSDCRDPDDGPHSGTWVSQAYENNFIEKSFLVGFSELHNNDTCVDNLIKYNVDFKDFTCQRIQSGKTTIQSCVNEIIKCVKTKYLDLPVVLCIDGDSVCNLPASAGNSYVGFSCFDIYPMIYNLSNELNVKAIHIAEIKPSLDLSKEQAVGEFLMQSTYQYLQGSIDKQSKI